MCWHAALEQLGMDSLHPLDALVSRSCAPDSGRGIPARRRAGFEFSSSPPSTATPSAAGSRWARPLGPALAALLGLCLGWHGQMRHKHCRPHAGHQEVCPETQKYESTGSAGQQTDRPSLDRPFSCTVAFCEHGKIGISACKFPPSTLIFSILM